MPATAAPFGSDFLSVHNFYRQNYCDTVKSIEQDNQRTVKLNPTKIPIKCWVKILQFLSPREIFSVVQVCRFFTEISDDNGIWKQYWKQNYEYSALLPTEKSWKLKFRFHSGAILKSGSAHLKAHKNWPHWHLSWLAISDCYLYVFQEPQPPETQNISDLIRFSDTYFKIPLLKSMISKKNKWHGSGKYKFKINTSSGEKYVFSALSEEDLLDWCNTLVDYAHSATQSFPD